VAGNGASSGELTRTFFGETRSSVTLVGETRVPRHVGSTGSDDPKVHFSCNVPYTGRRFGIARRMAAAHLVSNDFQLLRPVETAHDFTIASR